MADPLNEFEVLNKLGSGAFSSVYKVRRKTDGMYYALKRVPLASLPEQEKQNALNEVRIIASIRHTNIVGYRQSFIDISSNTLCIIMEYADEGDLLNHIGQHVKEGSFLKENKIWSILIQVLRGLGALHELGVQHRDLKSANVLLNSDGRVLITDFNVSKICKQNSLSYTQTGTPYYASPEVWLEIPRDSKADIWSLGCILYEMCSLRPPFKAPDMKALSNRITKGEILESDLMQMTILKYCPQELVNDSYQQIPSHSILLNTIELPSQLTDFKLILPATNYSKNSMKLNVKSNERTSDIIISPKSIDNTQIAANSTVVKKQYYYFNSSSSHDTSKETILIQPKKSIAIKNTYQVNDSSNLINNNKYIIASKVSPQKNDILQKKLDAQQSNRNIPLQQQNNSICLSNLDISLDQPQIVRNSQSVRNAEPKMNSLEQHNQYFKRAVRNVKKNNNNNMNTDISDIQSPSSSPKEQDLSCNNPPMKIVMIPRKKRAIDISQDSNNHPISSQLPIVSPGSCKIADPSIMSIPKSESRQQKQLSDYLNQYQPPLDQSNKVDFDSSSNKNNNNKNGRITNLSNINATKSSIGQRNYTEINKQRQQFRLRSLQARDNGQNEYTKRDQSAQELTRESASMGVNINCKKRIEQMKISRSMTVNTDHKSNINQIRPQDIENELLKQENINNSNRKQSRQLDHCISLLDSSLQEGEALGLAKLLRKEQKSQCNNNSIIRPTATSSHSNHEYHQDQSMIQQTKGKRNLTLDERPLLFLPQIISKTQSTRGQYDAVQRNSPTRFQVYERQRIKTDDTSSGNNSSSICVSELQHRQKAETETNKITQQKNIYQHKKQDKSAQLLNEENESVYQQSIVETDEKESLVKIQQKQYSPRRFRF